MKKSRSMRLASALLVLTLLSTCMISGTFAKYVTSDSASDSARVAKFGVVVTASGDLFDDEYKGEADAVTVQTAAKLDASYDPNNPDNVVAPGTKNEEGMTFAVTGKPEVKVKVDVVVTKKGATADDQDPEEEIFLKANNTLPDMTTGNATDTFENTADYYPVKYTLTQTKEGATPIKVTFNTVADLETALEAFTKEYAPNTDLAKEVGTINITWAWDFDNSGAGTYDKQDTLLGDLAAGTTLAPETTLTDGIDYNLTTDFAIKVSVTQID